MRKSATALITALLVTAAAGTFLVRFGKANFLPDIDPSMVIETPHYNRTYNTDTVTLNFTATTNWDTYPFFYSIDGQENLTVENVTVISQKEASPPSGLSVSRTTVRGSCVLSKLTEGWHNLTLCMVTDHVFNLYRTYEKGEILALETTAFFVETSPKPESFPTIPVVAVSVVSIVAVAAAGLVFARRRRQKEAQRT